MKDVNDVGIKQKMIMKAAEKLFATKGFEATSIREIAKEAGINSAMISYYFGSKEKMFEILFKIRTKQTMEFVNEVMQDDNQSEAEKMFKLIRAYVERVKNAQNFYQIVHNVVVSSKNKKITNHLKNMKQLYYQSFESLIENGYRKKIFTKKPSAFLFYSTIAGTVFYVLQSKKNSKELFGFDLSTEEFEEQYFDNLETHILELSKILLGYNEK